MSAKHTEVRRLQRQTDHDEARHEKLRHMLGTGAGIPRILSRASNGAALYRPAATPGLRISHLMQSLLAGPDMHTDTGQLLRHQRYVIDVAEALVPITEVSMSHYRAVAAEMRALELKLKRYVAGHRWEAAHVSPFGEDRFRKFDPRPAYESAGYVRSI